MDITVSDSGDFRNIEAFLKNVEHGDYLKVLDRFGRMGVDALASATPVDSGLTASSWGYQVKQTKSSAEIVFTNSNVNKGVNVAIILQYGHGTGTGGYIQGIDYINPALKPVFETIAEQAWKEVTR